LTRGVCLEIYYNHCGALQVRVKDPVSGEMVTKKTCKAALGYSFAGGTTDGPGAFDFTQGMTTGNPFWEIIKKFVVDPSEEIIECHK